MEFIYVDVKCRKTVVQRFGEEKQKTNKKTPHNISLTLLQVDWLNGYVLVNEGGTEVVYAILRR